MPRRPATDAFQRSSQGPGAKGQAPKAAKAKTARLKAKTAEMAPAGGGGSPREQLTRLGFQIQVLATKLESLRDRAEALPEYAKLQQLLADTQAKYKEAELAVKGRS